ncbi:hypothetical protein A2U01_0091860, partial [Trifolium medium]|nr:hypothetical protein [Trifolium medium]
MIYLSGFTTFAAKLRFAIVIVNSDNGFGRRKQKLVLRYERRGVYKRT